MLNSYYSDFNELSDLYSNSNDLISIYHFNVRSFAKNGDDVLLFLSGLPSLPDVIVMSETWFSDDYVEEINGYSGHHVYRNARRGGGVSVFVNDRFRATLLPQQCYIQDDLEMCSVRISVNNCHITIFAIYRPPSKDIFRAIELLDPALSAIRSSQRAFIVGDMNIDIVDPSPLGMEFINFCYSHSFLPLISSPTHIGTASNTCLDHIYYNQSDDFRAGIFRTNITDHYPVFVIMSLCQSVSRLVAKRFRDHSDSCLGEMRDKLSSFCDGFGLEENSFNHRFTLFFDGIQEIYDNCCPIREKFMSVKRSLKPWISNNLIRCINRKHFLFKQYKRGLITFERYNVFKNYLTALLRRTKERYYQNKFTSHVNDSRKTWKLINSLVVGKQKSKVIEEIEVNGSRVTNSLDIANNFSDFFSNVAINLDRLVPQVDKSAVDYLGEPFLMSMFVPPASDCDVRRVISELPCKSCDINEVPSFIYKYFSDMMSPILAAFFNESSEIGIFPERLKLARVVPVYKSGDKLNVTNYRPISTLSFLSKVFEKLMYKRLMSYLCSNSVICNNQFGFRRGFNTSDAFVELLDNLYESLNKKKVLVSVFLDLSKAFDTVNHSILLAKLDNIGIRGRVNNWFGSYIGNRKQYVSVYNCASNVTTPIMGVPQGSTLGPILFLLYINDMYRCSDMLNLVHFADDTTALMDADHPNDLVESVNRELSNVMDWMCANRLSLNVGKTCYMVVTDKNVQVPDIKINDRRIDRVTEAKFLGINLDSRLSFIPHVSRLCKQVSKATGILNRLSPLLPVGSRLKVYFALIYSRINYGVIAWGKCNLTSISQLGRVVARSWRSLRSSSVVRSKLLNFNSIYAYAISDKLFRVTRMGYHSYFERIYRNLQPDHQHRTRFSISHSYNLPTYCKSKCQRGFLYQSISVWNDLPSNLREIDDLQRFRRCLKMHLRLTQN